MPYPSYSDIAGKIDHSLLRPNTPEAQLIAGCEQAVKLGVASVCIVPYAVPLCVELLQNSPVQPSTTIGFPHGAVTTSAKVHESVVALEQGATELDMVVNIGQVVSGQFDAVAQDIGAVLEATRSFGQKLKVIFENCYLDHHQKLKLCEICSELRVDWVKTSTGFGSGGATLQDVQLMIENTPAEVQVKAAGGLRTLDALLEMHRLGASRLGTSATDAVLSELAQRISDTEGSAVR